MNSGLGCEDAVMAESGHVYATVPSNLPPGTASRPCPCWDFSPTSTPTQEPRAQHVRPQVIAAYAGGDIVLPATGARLSPHSQPNLARCLGHTLVHTDGTTLLGADDKAGIAEIMTLVDWLVRHPEFLHGKLRVAFTPDEEIGRGVDLFDLPGFGAHYAYTLDGSDLGEVEDETFSADAATVTIVGHDVHPGQAKNVMINAVRVAAALVEALPTDRLPETTAGREPYLHPHSLTGDVARAQLRLLVRAFTEKELHEREEVLRETISQVETRFPGARVSLEIKPSYRNMGDHIAKDPKVLDYAMEAVRRQGLEPIRRAVRGGTDGSRLSALGLLTPNLFTGGQSAHSVLEWISVQWMAAAVGVCLHLIEVWVEIGARIPHHRIVSIATDHEHRQFFVQLSHFRNRLLAAHSSTNREIQNHGGQGAASRGFLNVEINGLLPISSTFHRVSQRFHHSAHRLPNHLIVIH
jgi:tripeptide aminopeptidase